MEHRDIPATEQHGIVRWLYANEAAMLAASVTADDLYKVAQVGVGAAATFHVLNSVAPNVYVAMSGTPSSPYVTNMDFSANTLTLSFSSGPDIAVIGIAADADLDALALDVGTIASDLAAAIAAVGQPNGIASLNALGVVPDTQVPSYVYADLASFPPVGASGKIYCALDTGKLYTPIAGPAYQEVSPGFTAIADQTMLGNISGGSALPIALTRTQIRTLHALLQELSTDRTPGVANNIAGSGNYLSGDDIQITGGTLLTVLSTLDFNSGAQIANAIRVLVAASNNVTLGNAKNSAVIASDLCVIGSSNATQYGNCGIYSSYNCTITALIGGTVSTRTILNSSSCSQTGTAGSLHLIANSVSVTDSCTGNYVTVVGASDTVTVSGSGTKIALFGTMNTCTVSAGSSAIFGGYGTISNTAGYNFGCQGGSLLGGGTVVGGSLNGSATGAAAATSVVLGGTNNQLQGSNVVILGSDRGQASGGFSLLLPSFWYGSSNNPAFGEAYAVGRYTRIASADTNSVIRSNELLAVNRTTDATPIKLYVPETTTPQEARRSLAAIAQQAAVVVEVEIFAETATSSETLYRKIRAVFTGSRAATATQVGTTDVLDEVYSGAANLWGTAFVANTSSPFGIQVEVTGAAATTISWTSRWKILQNNHS